MLLTSISCKDSTFYEGDFFFLVNKGSKMPVSVRGNAIKNFIISDIDLTP